MIASGSGERRRLKILHIDPERNWGGGEAQVLGLLGFLTAKGHRNELLTHPEGQLFARTEKLQIKRLPLIVRNDLDLRAVLPLRRQISAGDYDVVHFHTKRAHALSLWLPRHGCRSKYLVTRRMDYPERKNWYTRCLYNHKVDGVVAISQAIANLLMHAGVEQHKIRLIPSGIDPKRFLKASRGPGPTNRPATIGCLAALEQRKGIQYLLEAVALLQARGIELQCAIAGEGSLRTELEERARTLGLHENIRFLGFASDNAAFLAGIDIFVMPSLFEGLGVAVLEAMAASVPVVASRIGGLKESVLEGVTGLLVPPRDAGALADAITELLSAPELAREMGRKGRDRVLECFTLEQMAAKNESYYYELLDEVH